MPTVSHIPVQKPEDLPYPAWSTRLIWRAAGILLVAAGAGGLILGVTQHLPTWAIPAGLGLVGLGAAGLSWGRFWRLFVGSTIRTRLLIGFLFMALLPALGISAGTIVVGYYNGRQQAIDQLESVAALKDLEIQSWINRIQPELSVAINEEFATERASIVLRLAKMGQRYGTYNSAMRTRFRVLVGQSAELTELFLIDIYGRVALSTIQGREGQEFIDAADLFYPGLTGLRVIKPPPNASVDYPSLVVLLPVYGNEGEVIGAVAGRAPLDTLEAILSDRTGLGESGKAYLVQAGGSLLSGVNTTAPIQTLGSQAILETHQAGSGVYTDFRETQVIGVYRWIPLLDSGLLVEKDLAEAFRGIFTNLVVNLSIALAAVLLAITAALFITRSIANPLDDLVDTATRIASGDIDQMVRVVRKDEIGILALAFNSMTAQLRDLISGLERRVIERTEALQRRALQLEISAQVSRQATSIHNINDLLSQVVHLIREAFGYYHVSIYLSDPQTMRLTLWASSPGMSQQNTHLAMGGDSLNGDAARSNRALLVNDVQADPRYLPDLSLPETRSELVLPLRLGDRVIGTLDVHSAQSNAFHEEDVLVLQSLGDQLAIAIENARLYDQTRELAILEERTRLARELHDSVTQSLYSLSLLAEGWRRLAKAGGEVHVEDYLRRFGEITQQALKEMRLLVYEMRPPVLEQEGLIAALRQRLDAVEKRAGIEARLVVTNLVELPAPVEEGLYWIAQEALNNALKHASASTVTVRVYTQGSEAIFEITDDGQGFEPVAASTNGGMGLSNMKARAEEVGASLEIESSIGQGTTVRVCLNKTGRLTTE